MRSFHPCLTSVVSYYQTALRQVPGPLTALLLKRSERPSDTIERLPGYCWVRCRSASPVIRQSGIRWLLNLVHPGVQL